MRSALRPLAHRRHIVGIVERTIKSANDVHVSNLAAGAFALAVQMHLGVGHPGEEVMNPLVLGLLFFVTIMPIGLVMRAFGKDFLRLKLDRNAKSYWIEREPPGPPPQSMRNQF